MKLIKGEKMKRIELFLCGALLVLSGCGESGGGRAATTIQTRGVRGGVQVQGNGVNTRIVNGQGQSVSQEVLNLTSSAQPGQIYETSAANQNAFQRALVSFTGSHIDPSSVFALGHVDALIGGDESTGVNIYGQVELEGVSYTAGASVPDGTQARASTAQLRIVIVDSKVGDSFTNPITNQQDVHTEIAFDFFPRSSGGRSLGLVSSYFRGNSFVLEFEDEFGRVRLIGDESQNFAVPMGTHVSGYISGSVEFANFVNFDGRTLPNPQYQPLGWFAAPVCGFMRCS